LVIPPFPRHWQHYPEFLPHVIVYTYFFLHFEKFLSTNYNRSIKSSKRPRHPERRYIRVLHTQFSCWQPKLWVQSLLVTSIDCRELKTLSRECATTSGQRCPTWGSFLQLWVLRDIIGLCGVWKGSIGVTDASVLSCHLMHFEVVSWTPLQSVTLRFEPIKLSHNDHST
jgi:hypothetical protein